MREKPAKTFAAYEDEDQSASGVQNGQKVRHKMFGVGRVGGIFVGDLGVGGLNCRMQWFARHGPAESRGAENRS